MKTIVVHIRMGLGLRKKIQERAGEVGMGISEWMRGLALWATEWGDGVNGGKQPSKKALVTTLDSTAPPSVDKKGHKEVEKVEPVNRKRQFAAYQ